MAIDKKLKEEIEKHLDPMEISRLQQMDAAAKQMDIQDKNGAIVKEDGDGDE